MWLWLSYAFTCLKKCSALSVMAYMAFIHFHTLEKVCRFKCEGLYGFHTLEKVCRFKCEGLYGFYTLP